MKMNQNYRSALLLLWALLPSLANTAYADPTNPVDINNLLNSKNHPYFLQPYTDKEHETLKELYQLNQGQLLWFSTEHPVQTIDQLLDFFTNAPTQGLNSSDYASLYLKSQWQKLQQSNPGFHEFATFDIALSSTFLRYLNDLHYGRVNPNQLGFSLPQKNIINFASHLYGAIQLNTISTLPERMEPKHPDYQQLKKTLAKYRRLNQHFNQAVHFNFDHPLYAGDWSTQINELEYYLDALNTPINQPITSKTTTSNIYTDSIAEKVRNLQTNHNLLSDGVLGKKTLEALNTPLSKRITQIELAMERLRWLPEQQEGPFILINIPAFQLWAYNTGQEHGDILNMKVVVGKAKNNGKGKDKALQTPVFTANMSYLVFNPYWNIPKSILKKEILPLVEKKPDYLQSKNMEIVAQFSHDTPALPINQENISRLYNGQLHLRQRPGTGNALGHIKFIFPNSHNVYLHDTPSLSLFNRQQRDFSHGCIRVEDPDKLAMFVLQEQLEWNNTKIQNAMTANKPNIIDIKQTIPVLIFYTTTSVTKTGITFYLDIYNHDSILQDALAERSHLFAIRNENSIIPEPAWSFSPTAAL